MNTPAPQDYIEAIRLLRAASDQGHYDAPKLLNIIYTKLASNK